MPLIPSKAYRPPLPLRWGHANTIYPTLFRRPPTIAYQRERIATPDDDFLDLDHARVGAERAAIVLHGLEGDAQRHYMRGMTAALNRRGWDAVGMNMRGCSGEPNRQVYAYHSGKTDDLGVVVDQVLASGRYRQLALVGFSLGGNQVLKYLGEQGRALDPRVVAGVGISVLVDLASGSRNLARRSNAHYMRYFMRMLHEKVRTKKAMFPELVDDEGIEGIRSFAEFDGRYTAPWHGFASAEDYWDKASCKHHLGDIQVPALLLNAADDPFMTPESYPLAAAEDNPDLTLEIPRWGGHVGFARFRGEYYSEQRAGEFLAQVAG